jgi:YHS domain-containing protein
MEELFDVLGIVPNLAGGQTATEQTYFEVNYTFYLNLIAFALSGFLLFVYRKGLGAPGAFRDPVCGMRTDSDGPSATHDSETYHFCSRHCQQTFEDDPMAFAHGESRRVSRQDHSEHEHH